VPAGPADYAALALGCREFARAAHRDEADALATQLLVRANQLFFRRRERPLLRDAGEAAARNFYATAGDG